MTSFFKVFAEGFMIFLAEMLIFYIYTLAIRDQAHIKSPIRWFFCNFYDVSDCR